MKFLAVVLSLTIFGAFFLAPPVMASKMNGKSYGSSDGGMSAKATHGLKKTKH